VQRKVSFILIFCFLIAQVSGIIIFQTTLSISNADSSTTTSSTNSSELEQLPTSWTGLNPEDAPFSLSDGWGFDGTTLWNYTYGGATSDSFQAIVECASAVRDG